MDSIIKRIIDQPMITLFDVGFMISASIGIYLLRALLIKRIFIPLGKKMGVNDEVGLEKFYENCWYVFYYTTMLLVGYLILRDKPFFPCKYELYYVFPVYKDWSDFIEMRFYYLIQISFYFQMTATFLWERRRKDFYQYCIHHGCTVLLLIFSFMAGQHRIGVNVLFIHDISDIFLHLSKILHYIHIYTGKKWADYLVYVTFFSFAFSFFITRLYIFPIHIIKESLFHPSRYAHVEATYLIKEEIGANAGTFFFINNEKMCSFDICISPLHFLIGMLILLLCLHIFWGYLILRMLMDYILFGAKKDIRSDEEENDDITYDKSKKLKNGSSKHLKNGYKKNNSKSK